jgi:hypothetical protein
MTKTIRTLLVAVILPLLSAPIWAGAAYDFSYVSHGDAEVRPVQVFDDGATTYFHLNGAAVPLFIVRSGTEDFRVDAQRSGQLLAVPALARDFQIRFGNLKAQVRYVGPARADKLPEVTPAERAIPTYGAEVAPFMVPPSVFGPAMPAKGPTDLVEFSDRETLVPFAKGKTALTPAAAKQVMLGLMGSGTVERVLIIGRDDAAYIEGAARSRGHAIRDRVIAAGVPSEKVIVKEMAARDGESQTVLSDMVVTWAVRGIAPRREEVARSRVPQVAVPTATQEVKAPSDQLWTVRKTDENVERMLTRWAAEAGWKVLWQNAPTVEITGDESISRPDFLQAADYVVNQAKDAGYKLRAKAYDNNWLVISGENK